MFEDKEGAETESVAKGKMVNLAFPLVDSVITAQWLERKEFTRQEMAVGLEIVAIWQCDDLIALAWNHRMSDK